jgi:hypothetical protein
MELEWAWGPWWGLASRSHTSTAPQQPQPVLQQPPRAGVGPISVNKA